MEKLATLGYRWSFELDLVDLPAWSQDIFRELKTYFSLLEEQ